MFAEWVEFGAAILCGLLTLICPGFLLFKVAGFRWFQALVFAPIGSVSLCAILSILYSLAGISSSPISLTFFPIVCLIGALVLIRRFGGKRVCFEGQFEISSLSLVLYVALGIAFAIVYFVKPLDGPSSFLQLYDNAYHLNAITSFVETNDFSSLSVSLYPDMSPSQTPFKAEGAFYPSAWHAEAALIVQLCSCSVPVAVNALNFALISVCYPLSFLALMSVLFSGNRKIILYGVVFFLSFSVFPWSFLHIGPQYPNMAGLLLLPSVVALFLLITQGGKDKRAFVVEVAIFLFLCAGLALIHPNTIFTAIVFLVPYCVYRIFSVASWSMAKRCFVSVGFLLMVGCVWFAFLQASFMESVLSVYWKSQYSIGDAIGMALNASYEKGSSQVLLGLVVVGGILQTVIWKKYLWISDRKSTRLNSSHEIPSRMPSSA